METFAIDYKPLFRVRVLHRYWLNFGPVDFDRPTPAPDPAPAITQALALLRLQYDSRRFGLLRPDAATADTLAGHRMLVKPLPDGFTVLLPTTGNLPDDPLPDDFALTFALHITDPAFWIYTDLPDPVIKALLKDSRRFRLKNGPAPGTLLNAAESLSLADLDPLPPPAPPASLTPKTTEVGYIEIAHRPAENRRLLTNSGRVQSNLTFDLRLTNRSTSWEFEGANQGSFPLVQNGLIEVSLAGGRKLPNPTPATTENRSGTYVSRIF